MKFCKDCTYHEKAECSRFSNYDLVTGELIEKITVPCKEARRRHQQCGPQGLLFERVEPKAAVTPIKSTTKKKVTRKS